MRLCSEDFPATWPEERGPTEIRPRRKGKPTQFAMELPKVCARRDPVGLVVLFREGWTPAIVRTELHAPALTRHSTPTYNDRSMQL